VRGANNTPASHWRECISSTTENSYRDALHRRDCAGGVIAEKYEASRVEFDCRQDRLSLSLAQNRPRRAMIRSTGLNQSERISL